MKKNTFGDYIVFVDESGDQSLVSIDKQYPVLVLSFCIFEKKHYVEHVVPEILKLKFDFFGSNIPILHEREIRKRIGVFNILMEDTVRNEFFNRLNQIIESSNFTIVSTVIDKNKYSHYDAPKNPYVIGMNFGIERIFYELQERNQVGKTIPIIFESRGNKEDSNLEKAFRNFIDSSNICGIKGMFDFNCISKSANLQGLQLADLVARPIGIRYLHPTQSNRAYDILINKIRRSRDGEIKGYGVKVYPKRNLID